MSRSEGDTDRLQVDVAVLCSRPLELSALSAAMRASRRIVAHKFSLTIGQLGPLAAALLLCPQRRSALAGSIEALSQAHEPKLLICAQSAIGLDPSLEPGSVQQVAELANEAGKLIQCSVVAPQGAGAKGVRMLTVSRWPRTAEAKGKLAERTGAALADTTAWHVAEVSLRQALPVAAVAVVVDSAKADSAPELLAIYGPTASYRAGAILGASLYGVGRIGTLWRLRSEAKQHAAKLAQAIVALCRQLALMR